MVIELISLAEYTTTNVPQKDSGAIYATVVSLFSGCGGMDLGFIGGFDFLGTTYSQTGLEIIWANEINPAACMTYKQNIGDHIVNADIGDVFDQLPKTAEKLPA